MHLNSDNISSEGNTGALQKVNIHQPINSQHKLLIFDELWKVFDPANSPLIDLKKCRDKKGGAR